MAGEGKNSVIMRAYRNAARVSQAPVSLFVGEWLSLVEHLVRDQGVGGSNPLSPTNSNQVLADARRVGEKQGLPKKDLHWRKRFRCGHELPPYRGGSHAHGFNSLFPPRLVVDILGHVDCGMSHVVPRYLWPDANTAHQA